MKTNTIFLLVLIMLTACNKPKEETFWVSGFKKQENNIATLLVQRSDTLKNEAFVSLNKDIKGFNFEEGYLKKIVTKTQVNNYILIKELEKKVDYRMNLLDKWKLQKQNDSMLLSKLASLEINLTNMSFQGNSCCNNYSGKIKVLSFNSIKFEKAVGTKKYCALLKTEAQYLEKLSLTNTYLIKGKNPYLYDKKGMKILSFTKQ